MPRGIKGSGKALPKTATKSPSKKTKEEQPPDVGYTAWSILVKYNESMPEVSYGMCVADRKHNRDYFNDKTDHVTSLCGKLMTRVNAAPLAHRQTAAAMVEYMRPYIRSTNPYVCRDCANKIKALATP